MSVTPLDNSLESTSVLPNRKQNYTEIANSDHQASGVLSHPDASKRKHDWISHNAALEEDQNSTQQLDPQSYDLWVDRRTSWINFSWFMATGILQILIPYLIFRYILGVQLICYKDEFHTDPNQAEYDQCDDDSEKISQSTYLLMINLVVPAAFVGAFHFSSNPEGRSQAMANKILPFWFIYMTIISFFKLGSLYNLFLLQPPIWGYISGYLLDRKGYHRAGLKLGIMMTIQIGVTLELVPILGKQMDKEMFSGVKYSILTPFFIQINQGITILAATRLASTCKLTNYNMDYFIILAKYQFAFINTLKICALLQVIGQGDFISTLALNVILDALGRNQVWRIMYRLYQSMYHATPFRKSIPYLVKIFLWAEFDTDYIPFAMLVLMNIFKSPFHNEPSAIFHVSNSSLDLHDSSLLNQSFGNIAIILLMLIVGDIVTYMLSAILKHYRLYECKLHFTRSTTLACLLSPFVFRAEMFVFLAVAHVLNQ